MEDLKPFGLGSFVSLIRDVRLLNWGNKLVFECVYDPIDRKPYKLIFTDCTPIKWLIHSPENAENSEADVIDIQLIQDKNQKTAVIYTDIFELLISYGSLIIEKDW